MSRQVLIIGGSGFIGQAVASRFCEAGHRVRVATRRHTQARPLLLLPTVEVVAGNPYDPTQLASWMADVDLVINLVGVLHSPPGDPWGEAFEQAHVVLPRTVARACRDAGVGRFIHVSALGADAEGPSAYQRSKAAGEAAVREHFPEATILRPSVVFGRGDRFINLFDRLTALFPVIPLAGASCRFQPVWVGDVATVMLHCLEGDRDGAAGQTFELAGPTVYTLKELVEFVAGLSGRRRLVVPISERTAMLQARVMEWLPKPLMSRDNVLSMRADNVATGAPLPFGLSPSALAAVAPGWLGHDKHTRAAMARGRSSSPAG